MKTSIQTDYHTEIDVHCSPEKAFDAICRVPAWWTENTAGDSQHQNGEFTVRFGDTFSRFKVIDFIRGQKMVWHVLDCNLHWMNDKKEWKGTKILWQVNGSGNSSRISMTHIGLNAGIECFEDCTKGWNHYVRISLFKLIEECKGEPDHKEYSALEKQ